MFPNWCRHQTRMFIGRIAGPFDHPPFANFRCSSWCCSEKGFETNIVVYITYLTQSAFPVQWTLVSLMNILNTQSSLMLCTSYILVVKDHLCANLTLKMPFATSVHPDDRHLLGMHWNGKFYFDKCLLLVRPVHPVHLKSSVHWSIGYFTNYLFRLFVMLMIFWSLVELLMLVSPIAIRSLISSQHSVYYQYNKNGKRRILLPLLLFFLAFNWTPSTWL